MKKNIIKCILSSFLLMMCTTTLLAQMNYFTLPPRKWDVRTTTVTSSTISGAFSFQYMNGNGAYDENGNLLFYVQDNIVYNSSSSSVGMLLDYYPNGFTTDPSLFFSALGSEIAIVPIPGTCKQFYVIFTKGKSLAFESACVLLYMKVDCTSGSPVLSSPTADPVGTMPYRHLINSFGGSGGGIAVSKLVGANRYLFSLASGSAGSMIRYTITSSGIGSATTIATSATYPSVFPGSSAYYINELELSSDQKYLAWGGTKVGSKLYILGLDASYVGNSGTTYNIDRIKGVEFNNHSGTSDRVFVSSLGLGISYITIGTPTTVNTIASSTGYNNSYVELAKNGKMYCVSTSGVLGEISNTDAGSPSVTAGPAGTIFSNGGCLNNGNDDAYRLNDQIDGENYDYFYGTSIPVAGFTVNGTNSSPTCTPSTPQIVVFSCPSYMILLSNLSTGGTTYTLTLKSTDASGNPISGTGLLGTYTTNISAPIVNLKTLPGTNGDWLSFDSHAGYYTLTLQATNACGVVSSKCAFLRLVGTPTGVSAAFKTSAITKAGQTLAVGACTVPASTGLVYQDGTTSCGGAGGYKFTMEHSNVATPNEVGRLNTAFDLTGVSAGTGSSSYTVNITTDRWTGSAWQNMNYLGVPENYTGITTFNLNGLLDDDPSNPYYLAFGNAGLTPDGSIYRITVGVTNECATYTSSQIIKLNTTKLRREILEQTSSIEKAEALPLLYPNPANGETNFNLNATAGDLISITVFDIKGSKILDVINKAIASEGVNNFKANINELKPGMYFYHISINDTYYSGKLIKE